MPLLEDLFDDVDVVLLFTMLLRRGAVDVVLLFTMLLYTRLHMLLYIRYTRLHMLLYIMRGAVIAIDDVDVAS
jgi:hypothetical protein